VSTGGSLLGAEGAGESESGAAASTSLGAALCEVAGAREQATKAVMSPAQSAGGLAQRAPCRVGRESTSRLLRQVGVNR